MQVVSCPRCSRPVEWSPKSRYRPFCSERCRLIDLGEWATEGYRIPDEAVPDPDESDGSSADTSTPPKRF